MVSNVSEYCMEELFIIILVGLYVLGKVRYALLSFEVVEITYFDTSFVYQICNQLFRDVVISVISLK